MAPPPPSPPSVMLKTVILLLRVLTAIFLVISVVVLTTNNVTLEFARTSDSIKFRFQDVFAYRYMLSAAVIGLLYAVVQLFFTISHFATGITHPFIYQFNFYGDKIISYLLATGSAAGFGVSKDLKDAYLAIFSTAAVSTDPVDTFFSKGYASASLLLLAFVSLAILSVFSSLALSKRPIQASQAHIDP